MAMGDYPVLNRPHFLKHLAGFSVMALPGMQFVQALRANAATLKKQNKSLIILWMGGGPSTIDLWDLKPGSPNGGDFKPMQTAVSSVQISEHLPNVAKRMQHLAIVRSLVSNEGDHDRGTRLMNTGRVPSPIVQYPAMGAVASFYLTDKNLALPGFISVGGTGQRIGPGFLGMTYAPFTVQNAGQPPANLKPLDDMESDTLRSQRRRRLFLAVEDSFRANLVPTIHAPSGTKEFEEERKKYADAAQAHSEIYGKAFSLMLSPQGKVFDVNKEPRKLIEEYGNNPFGKGCLLARRLAEAGVSCVEVDLGGWDNHAGIFPILKNQRLPALDKGMGGLVRDLVDRGMWKNTVVLWMGEFGRTPRINQNAGRDHWARCWSVVVGGGAIKGGQAYGSTDKDGLSVESNPVSVSDLFATVYQALGINPHPKVAEIRDNLGRQFEIAGKEGKVIKELVG